MSLFHFCPERGFSWLFLFAKGGFVSYLAEEIARAFHETYESFAPSYGYKTREASAVPWSDVPKPNKALMVAVVADLLDREIIEAGDEA